MVVVMVLLVGQGGGMDMHPYYEIAGEIAGDSNVPGFRSLQYRI